MCGVITQISWWGKPLRILYIFLSNSSSHPPGECSSALVNQFLREAGETMVVKKHWEWKVYLKISEEKCTCVRHQRLTGQSHVGSNKPEEVSNGNEEECQDQNQYQIAFIGYTRERSQMSTLANWRILRLNTLKERILSHYKGEWLKSFVNQEYPPKSKIRSSFNRLVAKLVAQRKSSLPTERWKNGTHHLPVMMWNSLSF